MSNIYIYIYIYKFLSTQKYALFASQNVSMVDKRETKDGWMEESERIREERGLFFGIIWVNGTHGSMVLALVKLEGEQNKGKYEGEIKAACQLTRRMDRTIYIYTYIRKIEQDYQAYSNPDSLQISMCMFI